MLSNEIVTDIHVFILFLVSGDETDFVYKYDIFIFSVERRHDDLQLRLSECGVEALQGEPPLPHHVRGGSGGEMWAAERGTLPLQQ